MPRRPGRPKQNSSDTTCQLIAKINSIHSQLDRFGEFVNSYAAAKLPELLLRAEKIELVWTQFEELMSELESLDDSHSDLRIEFEEKYFKHTSLARDIIKQANPTQSESDQKSHAKIVSSQCNNSNNDINNFKLPQINLPEFYGHYDQWISFHDAFNALIHTNNTLTNIQKFYYLKLCLKGKATDILESLAASESNYTIAWKLLTERYENERIIVNTHIKALFDLQPITKDSHTGLRSLLDNFQKHCRALEALKQPTKTWGPLLIHLITSKFDTNTLREWESSVTGSQLPSLEQLINFITKKCQVLEAINPNKLKADLKAKQSVDNRNKQTHSFLSSSRQSCAACKADHLIYSCPEFLKLTPNQRLAESKRLNICINCLKPNHSVKNCKSSNCKKCSGRHNSLLHFDKHIDKPDNPPSQNESESKVVIESQNVDVATSSTHCVQNSNTHVLLSTALVTIYDKFNNAHKCRALLDQGSQSNYISEELCGKLQLTKIKIHMNVTGINHAHMSVRYATSATIGSTINDYKSMNSFLVLDRITHNLPSSNVDSQCITVPNNITLADSAFRVSSKVDILLGAAIFWEIILNEQIRISKHQPVFHNTKLGWIVGGTLSQHVTSKASHYNVNLCAHSSTTDDDSLSRQLEAFWKIEECVLSQNEINSEHECEKHYKTHTVRDDTGRFIVALPFKDSHQNLGDSREHAINKFSKLEQRLNDNSDLKDRYCIFMKEYQDLGHMTEISDHEAPKACYYMPHHGVVKEASLTTKLRVVFDASFPSSSGISLNNILMVGPVVQQDLFSIVARFRKHNIVLTADIAKMYRQIRVRESDRDFQRIVWRSAPDQPLRHFKLNTVTYGTTPASFLATRSLVQAALDKASDFPEASRVIIQDFYVDDLVTGSETLDSAIKLKGEITHILDSAGFPLRQWSSNHSEVLSENDSNILPLHYLADKERCKTLGLMWNPNSDNFQYDYPHIDDDRIITKRLILSSIAKIFDPLGLIGPLVIQAKMLMQELWKSSVAWDDELPFQLKVKWLNLYEQIKNINKVEIPRQITIPNSIRLQIHGFCDASTLAFGACVYLRCSDYSDNHRVTLVCAKSRVAPVKEVTLPRLELCGALLLAQLVQRVLKALNLSQDVKVYYWSDSMIVLAWLAGEPGRWKLFVSNKVRQNRELCDPDQWHHVISSDNPADIISRGCKLQHLLDSSLWWHGPSWLQLDSNCWPVQSARPDTSLESRKVITTVSVNACDFDIFHRYSSLTKLIRVVAYILRFKRRALNKDKSSGPLCANELNEALNALVRLAQLEVFSPEIKALSSNKSLHKDSSILSLNPFLDSGLLRVGGRLRNSNLAYSVKHPLILPKGHVLTKLIIKHEHLKHLHAGPQLLLATIRQKFWPIRGLVTIKNVIKGCLVCFRAKPIAAEVLMGDLPNERTLVTRPFTNTGIDYAGPFELKVNKLRNSKTVKAYICIFICLSVKAVHLEVVSDLTTDSFLNTLKRFIARRGRCSTIWSDNATNFVGANNSLKDLQNLLLDNETNQRIVSYLAEQSISWRFISPRSPHHGGLWESAVKMAKYHLKRVVGVSVLNFEELHTLLVQIEACLNSRPLTPLSNDPQDLSSLTPGHFLIGSPLIALPDQDLTEENPNRLSKYQRLSQMFQHFWTRWRKEYISLLQTRNKRKQTNGPQLSVGDMVLIKDLRVPPLLWPLGRVTEMHPGQDGVVRVVMVKTRCGLFKRAINQLCVLPIEG